MAYSERIMTGFTITLAALAAEWLLLAQFAPGDETLANLVTGITAAAGVTTTVLSSQ